MGPEVPTRRIALATCVGLSFLALLGTACSGKGPRETHTVPVKKAPPKATARPTPGPPATPGTSPELSLHEAGLGCLTAACFSSNHFPAISADGKTIVVLAVRTVNLAVGGALEEYEEVSVVVLDATSGKRLRELPLIGTDDHVEAHQSVQEMRCVEETIRTGDGDPRLCPEDPELVKEVAPQFQETLQKRVTAVQEELARNQYEAMTGLAKAPAPGSGPAREKLVYLAEAECAHKVEVKDLASGKIVATCTAPEATLGTCDEGPSFVLGVWHGARHGVFLVAASKPDDSGDQELHFFTVKPTP